MRTVVFVLIISFKLVHGDDPPVVRCKPTLEESGACVIEELTLPAADGKMKVLVEITKVTIGENSVVKTISGAICEAFPTLKHLYINEAHTTAIGKDAFAACPDLHSVHFKNNYLSKLDEGAFSGPTNVNHIDLSHNKIAKFPDKFFEKTTHLKHLKLHENSISDFPLSLIASAKHSLHILCLAHNPIRDLDAEGLIKDFPNVAVVHLKGTSIPADRLAKIKQLFIDNDIITDFDENRMQRLWDKI